MQAIPLKTGDAWLTACAVRLVHRQDASLWMSQWLSRHFWLEPV